jgi:shikimate dehydrogenase
VIHEAVFEAIGVSVPYAAVRVSKGELGGFIAEARESNMRGFNVTRPHKLDIIPFLDEVDDEASLCGAVNTVVIREGRFIGYNTDMEGLLTSLRESGHDYRGRSVVILGSGGVSRSVALKAAREEAAEIVILARDESKASKVATDVRASVPCHISSGPMTPDSMEKAARGADILINATPLGMSGIGEDFASLDFLRALPKRALVCDLVYSPPVTSLCRRASELGLDAQNGLGMLIYQALLADELFLEKRLDKPELYKTVKERLLK